MNESDAGGPLINRERYKCIARRDDDQQYVCTLQPSTAQLSSARHSFSVFAGYMTLQTDRYVHMRVWGHVISSTVTRIPHRRRLLAGVIRQSGRGRSWASIRFLLRFHPPLSAPARLTVDTCRHMRERPAAIRSVGLRPWRLSMLLPLLFRWLASVPCVVCPSPCREQTIGRRRKARCHASLSPAEVNPGLLLLLLSSTCGLVG